MLLASSFEAVIREHLALRPDCWGRVYSLTLRATASSPCICYSFLPVCSPFPRFPPAQSSVLSRPEALRRDASAASIPAATHTAAARTSTAQSTFSGRDVDYVQVEPPAQEALRGAARRCQRSRANCATCHGFIPSTSTKVARCSAQIVHGCALVALKVFARCEE